MMSIGKREQIYFSVLNVRFWPVAARHERQKSANRGVSKTAVIGHLLPPSSFCYRLFRFLNHGPRF
jgi:hypothetical protein